MKPTNIKNGLKKAKSPAKKKQKAESTHTSQDLQFEDNTLAQELFGIHHANLTRLEEKYNIVIHARGNELTVVGEKSDVIEVGNVLEELYTRLERGLDVSVDEVNAAVRMSSDDKGSVADAQITIQTRNRTISPRSANQAEYLRAIDGHDLVFGLEGRDLALRPEALQFP